MATYKAQAIVLKKTKLREKDLILTLLGSDGSQLRCVAKGAQKPGSTFSARLEVLSVVDVLAHKGKSGLDTITEVRSIESNESCRTDLTRLSYGAIMTELLQKTALEGQEMPVLFPLTQTALRALGAAPDKLLPYVVTAHLIKVIAVLGYCPSFDECVLCGEPRGEQAADGGLFSIASGGWICPDCTASFDAPVGSDDIVDAATAAWLKALLGLTFAQVLELDVQGESLPGRLLDFCDRWAEAHLGIRLKSMAYLSRVLS